ncbi:prolipoprotein diacylglyceryl transferase [Patulibacter brassicae]|jgi:phosphatidylglycerol:prolipoprotein diacylglycerol transferase|uniref:Prolipoprotein diacylglyceryl transferase n=1 Tax=Patulibacter brassicae TaxID=1705717 RepID=A0ABU4VP16_9ACTN|nr:prolipoprotein diacylglyceryl transferase family protein [Patulibacter brassicae]MDX8153374.1 prolipoprotein diacylglyceryl transferase [Patulibacter brassicae]
MQPEIDLLGVPLKTFGICFALAFIAAGLLLARRFREFRWPAEHATEAMLAALAGGLIGARAYWLLDAYDPDTHGNLIDSLIDGAGLTWYGGAAGGALAVLAWATWRGHLEERLLGATAPVLALGYAIGRVGCQISGDGDYGKSSDLPWAMSYPDAAVPTTSDVQPTPIYETLAMGFAAMLLWQMRDRMRPAALFALYLMLAGSERLLIEFWRQNDEVVASLTTAQLTSVAMVLAGGIALLSLRNRMRRS